MTFLLTASRLIQKHHQHCYLFSYSFHQKFVVKKTRFCPQVAGVSAGDSHGLHTMGHACARRAERTSEKSARIWKGQMCQMCPNLAVWELGVSKSNIIPIPPNSKKDLIRLRFGKKNSSQLHQTAARSCSVRPGRSRVLPA